MSRLEWMLSAILALLLVVVVALALVFWSRQQSSQANLNNLPELPPQTAREAYNLARPVAEAWSADARLLAAYGTWEEGDFRPETGRWSYLFYAPARHEIGLVAVEENSARFLRASEAQQVVELAGTQQWQVDSPAVVAYLLARGGQAFIDEHQGNVGLSLVLEAYNGLTWKAALLAAEAGAVYQVEMDASNPSLVEPLDEPLIEPASP